MRNILEVIGLTIALTLMVLIIIPLIHFSAIGEIEEYNNLKETVSYLGVDSRTEDILGKVVDWNMRLASSKRYNKIPIVKWFVPDKLANLEYICIPKPRLVHTYEGLIEVTP